MLRAPFQGALNYVLFKETQSQWKIASEKNFNKERHQ